MSKLSFRARQVDYSKPLPIYYNNEIPDLQDFAAINRSVPQMPTGMEKDEEAEHHLQRALSALQVYGTTTSNEYAIPTPNVEIDNKMYERIYNVECPKQKQYIRIQPFSSDFDYPDYDADVEDEDWLNQNKKKLPNDFTDDLFLFFENVMDRLEKAAGFSTNLMSRDEAKMLLLENAESTEELTTSNLDPAKYKTVKDEFILCIYDYWKEKRLKCKHPLTPTVLTDKCGVVTGPNNPYLVFRRRTEKMQTRKNRKTEEQSYEKMLILKRDLVRAQQLLKLVKQRETIKKDSIKLNMDLFEKRLKSNDYDGTLTESIKSSILKTKSPAVQAILVQSKTNTDKKLGSVAKSPSVKREFADTKLIQTVNAKRHKKDKKLSPVNINTIQPPTAKSIGTPSSAKSTLANLFKTDKNKRFIRRPIGAATTQARVDTSDLCESKTPSPVRFEPMSTEYIEYNEELRLNNIENLDSALNEAKSLFPTSADKDGYWSFKRKEGCKYLAQNGSIFKDDAFDHFSSQEPDEPRRARPAHKDRLHQTQHHVYGYLVDKRRYLGLVRRRFGRGGRLLLDKINAQSLAIRETTNSNESNSFHSVDNLSQFKTYYPVENSSESVAVVPASDPRPDRAFYDHKVFAQTNPSNVDLYELEPLLAIKNFDMDRLLDDDSDTLSYSASSQCVKVDFRPNFNDTTAPDEQLVRLVDLKSSLRNLIAVKRDLVKPEPAEQPTRPPEDKPIKIEAKLLNAFNSPGSTLTTLISKLNEPLKSSSIRPIMNGNKYSTTSTSSLPSSSASSSSSSSPLSNTTTTTATKPATNTTTSSSASYLYTSAQSSLALNGIASKSNKFEIF